VKSNLAQIVIYTVAKPIPVASVDENVTAAS